MRKLNVEELESRFLLDAAPLPHPNNLVLQAEHLAVMNLVPYSAVNYTAVVSGDWDNPATWDHGVPTSEANVLIPHDLTVTLDSIQLETLRTIRVDGTFQFSSGVNTKIVVDTMIVDPLGSLIIGTDANPIQNNVTATITIADRGPIDRVWDPGLFSRGIVSHGAVTIHGADKTSFLPLAIAPAKGTTSLILSSAPSNWQVGDKLILPGVNPSANEDEQLEILGISGSSITVKPLLFNHIPPVVPGANLQVHLANITRNVIVESQNQTDISRRGHIMFMHSPNVHVTALDAIGLGRTDKKNPLNNAVLDANGQQVPGTGLNQVGRYAIHFHRAGDAVQSSIHDSVVYGSPGWGFVNHSSNVDIADNVSYGAVGAGFVTEAGDEVGNFTHNFSIRNEGSGLNIDNPTRNAVNDFGHTGDGFWLQGPGVHLVGNVSAGAARSGFIFFSHALQQKGLPLVEFPSQYLADPSIANGAATYPVSSTPIGEFVGNISYGQRKGGMELWFTQESAQNNFRSVIDGFTAWNLGPNGLTFEYNTHLTVKNSIVIANNPIKANGVGASMNAATKDIDYQNNRIEGFEFGIRVPIQSFHITGGLLRNVNNIHIQASPVGFRRDGFIDIDVVFGTLTNQELYGRVPRNIFMDWNSNYYYYWNSSGDGRPQDRVFYGDKEIYFMQEARDFVPYPTLASTQSYLVPSTFAGKTNQQIYDDYGLRVGGSLAPVGATVLAGTNALIGSGTSLSPELAALVVSLQTQLAQVQAVLAIPGLSQDTINALTLTANNLTESIAAINSLASPPTPSPYEEYLRLTSPISAKVISPYTLKYRNEAGIEVTYQTTFTLNLGYNVLTILVNGQKRSFIVQGT